ncbi:MAG: hypothetical protein GY872_02130 [Roseibacillus sp.]|nr:hypothetical protein [Roseibacillus sp.]
MKQTTPLPWGRSFTAQTALAIVAGSLSFAGSLPATEILENGSFENNNGFDGINSGFSWTSPNYPNEVFDVYNYTTQIWFTGPAPMGAGDWYFHTVGLGAIPDGAIVEQTLDLISAATGLTSRNIDAGGSQFTFSAQIAGYPPQTDTGLLELEFFDASDLSLGVAATLDGISGGDDGLIDTWDLFTESAFIPSGARKATVRILQTSAGSNGNDNYVDLVSLDVTAGPGKLQLEVSHLADSNELEFKWNSEPGKLYNLRSELDPSATKPIDWPIFGENANIVATPPENILTIPMPADLTRLFVVGDFPAPPVTLFTDDLESGAQGWTTVVNDASGNTQWELGSPSGSTGPLTGAGDSATAWSTNLGNYGPDSDIALRSPAFDLSGIASAELTFKAFRDTDGFGDSAVVRFLRAVDLLQLGAETALDMAVFDIDYVTLEVPVPTEAIGENVIIEWNFVSDGSVDNFSGLTIDDIEVIE